MLVLLLNGAKIFYDPFLKARELVSAGAFKRSYHCDHYLIRLSFQVVASGAACSKLD